jgi:CO/xanthine dehydrogenase Mo-binding subunit
VINATKNQSKGSLARVTGRLKYVDDIPTQDSLHAKLVRLPLGHAKIDSVEKDEALRVPGVIAVYTCEDLPRPLSRFGPLAQDQPVLANGKVKFAGQPIAVIIAESPRQAEQGVAAVKVSYTELPAIMTFEDALAPGAPLVQNPEIREANKWRETNIMGEWQFGWGDVGRAESQSAFTLTNTFKTPFIHHYALEPYAVYVLPEDDGITLYASIQHPFALRRIISGMLGLPISKVRVISTEMGGGFGGRGYPKIEPLAALLVHMIKRPVKISLTADEGFYLAQREMSRVWIRTGFKETGEITFQDVKADFLVGAYADISPRVVQKAGFLGTGPYWVPNVNIMSRGIFSNTAPTTAFRGFGATHLCFAIESQLNEAAKQLNVDPVKIRLRNLPEKGEMLVPGDNPVDGDWKSALLKAAEVIEWYKPAEAGHGKGIAIGIKSSVPATVSSAEVRLHVDGSATVYVGTTEMGQGSRTVMAKLVSKSLHLPFNLVRVVSGDTGRVPFDTITASSRSTVMMGQAVVAACNYIRKRLCELAAEAYQIDVKDINITDGSIHVGHDQFTYSQIIQHYFGPGLGEVVGHGSYTGEINKHHPLGGPAAFWEFIVTAVELSVDLETGIIGLCKLVNVSDAGKVINPLRAIGQDEGGAVMAIGAALMEKLVMDASGVVLNAGSLDYKVPTIADIPEKMETIFQENQDGPGPYGSKGIGESGILATLPAISGAIFDATELRVREIPITPEALWKLNRKNDE